MAGQVPDRGALIGPGFYTKLQQTIAKVDGEPYGGGVTRIPTDLSGGETFVPKGVRLATISPTAIGNEWLRNDARTATNVATGDTVTVISVFDNHTPLDFASGFAYVKAVDPLNPQETANVVITPPAVPLHAAFYTASSWPRGEQRIVTVPPAGARTTQVQVVASNDFLEDVDGESGPVAIGRVGTSFSVIAAAAQDASATPATLVTPIADGTVWNRGSVRSVRISGTTTFVDVVNPLKAFTSLDLATGLIFAKTKRSPLGGGTANVLISPAPDEVYEAYLSGGASEEWQRGSQKTLLVPPGDGRDTETAVSVTNKFFDTFTIAQDPVAIGRIGTSFCALTAPQSGGITPGTLVTPIATNEVWDKGSIRSVLITGTTTRVDVVNPFDELTHLEAHEGILFAKSQKDPNGGEGTANVLISPAPKEIYEAHFSSGSSEEWERGSQKTLLVPAGDGRETDVEVTVTNKFFDKFTLAQDPIVIGKFGTAFCAITAPQEDNVRLATRTDSGVWNVGSERPVRIHGTTVSETAINLAGDYEDWDARTEPYGPNLVIVKGKNIGTAGGGVSEGTMWYAISPAPQTFRTGTFTGQWAKGTSKTVNLLAASGPTGTVTAVNNFGSVGSTATSSVPKNCGISKAGGTWYLVAAECE